MIDFGSSNDHNKYINFGNSSVVGYLDAFWGVTILVRLKLKSAAGTWGYVFGKSNLTPAPQGWALRFDLVNYGTAPEFVFQNRVGYTPVYHRCSTALTVGEWYTLAFSWRGDQYGFWALNGSYVNTTSSGAAQDDLVNPAPPLDFHIGGAGGFLTSHGAAVEMDNVIIIPNLRLRQAGLMRIAADFHAGYLEPWAIQDRWLRSRDADPGILGPWFWWTGEYTPGYNVVKHSKGGHEAGSTPAGTPTAVKDTCNNPPWIFLDLGGAPSMSAGARPAVSKTGRLPTAMYAEVTGRNRVFLGLQLDLPDSHNLGFASAALPTSEREYELKVKQWSPIARERSDSEGCLTPVETSVVVADPGRALSKLLTGALDGRAEGSPARIRLVSPHVDPSGWVTVYEGELRRWSPRGNLPEITLYLGPNDKPLRGKNNLGYLTKDLWPKVPPTDELQPTPMIYGAFDSLVGGGYISCPKVSTAGDRYLVSVGMVTPFAAYQAGTMLDPRTSGGEYQIARCVERGGRWFTEIWLDADAGTEAITADVEGAAWDVNDTFTGRPYGEALQEDWRYNTPISNPAEQLLHALVNFVFGAYKKGPWLSPSGDTPIDVPSFIEAASWFRKRNIKGRTVVYGNETGYQLINRWVQQWRIPAFWNGKGKLALKPDAFAVVRGGQSRLIDREHGISNLVTAPDDSGLADEILLRHGYDWINEEFKEETRAKDLARSHSIRVDIDQDWSAA